VEAIEKIEIGLTCLLRQLVTERQGKDDSMKKEQGVKGKVLGERKNASRKGAKFAKVKNLKSRGTACRAPT
jgi:hypothetical protein